MMALAFIATLVPGLYASGSHKQEKAEVKEEVSTSVKGTQKVCPIRKEPIDPKSYVDVQGQRVYFCCSGCDKKFLADKDAKFLEMKERGEVAENIQTICPVSGEELENHDVSIALPGRNIYFCCKSCVKKFNKDTEGYLKKMDSAATEKKQDAEEHEGHNP